MSVSRHFVLAAGGTGGHMTPAFALASELIARGHRVALFTDARGEAISGRPVELSVEVLPTRRLSGGPVGWLKGVLAILRGRATAIRLMREFQPTAVVGFGGYPALPALLGAHAARIPSVIHEQNALLGRVNRFLAPQVNAIATAYEQVDRVKPSWAHKVRLIGNPVRADVQALRDRPFPPFDDDSLFRILVTGGSLGARILSDVVPDGLAMLPPGLRSRLQVTQQCRAEDIDAVRRRFASHGIAAELGTYFDDMASRLASAHLFIGRAGGMTVAELTVVGRPAILVPLPIATEDHQAANTREMVAAGAARMIRQPAFTASELAKQIEVIATRSETLGNAAHAAWNCGRPNAAADLADLVESFGRAPLMDVIRMGDATSVAEAGALAGAPA